MRYDAYRLPGVRWCWVGVGKSPEPDHWPEHVMIEGVKIETVRGKGWGMGRAFYKCPECQQARKSLYSASNGPIASRGQASGENAAERTRAQGIARVACSRHWPKSKRLQDDALLDRARADRARRGNWPAHAAKWDARADAAMALALA